MRDELEGATELEKNPSKEQMAEFSSSIQDVMEKNFSSGGGQDQLVVNQSEIPRPKWAKKYPLGLSYRQVEALLAGVAGVIGTSEPVQTRLASLMSQFYSESGKISVTGMAVMVIIVAVIFYFAKQIVLKSTDNYSTLPSANF